MHFPNVNWMDHDTYPRNLELASDAFDDTYELHLEVSGGACGEPGDPDYEEAAAEHDYLQALMGLYHLIQEMWPHSK